MNIPAPNPYEAPIASSNSKPATYSWWVLCCTLILWGVNVATIRIANTSFTDFLVEFGIELPVISQPAYTFAMNWPLSIAALTIAALITVRAHATLTNKQGRWKILFATIMITSWVLFTIGFGIAILMPLLNVATGLTN